MKHITNSSAETTAEGSANGTMKKKIAVIGQGYVGLPLAVEFAKVHPTIGFDINSERINELRRGYDQTREIEDSELKQVLCPTFQATLNAGKGLFFSTNLSELVECNIFIVTVPTPIDNYKTPDLNPLKLASKAIGGILKKDDIVIYESTTFPGCTEEICVPILEEHSNLKYNKDFFCGYSPERINPGDKVNTLTTIKKVTSGSNNEIAEEVDQLYSSIIKAGTHKASSLAVAEASKAIENAQRDLNISFVNELALIFDRMGIDTNEVLEAAGTKWNFLKFRPGLVGGHCIGVDPYYLAHKAQALGYQPEVILSGRRVNDEMGSFVANKLVKMMINKGRRIKGSRVLLLGITFKENCPDIRNTRVVDIVGELETFGIKVDVYDPWADASEVKEEYNIDLIEKPLKNAYKAVILCVAHHEFKDVNLTQLTEGESVIFDTKAYFDRNIVDARL